MAARKNNAQTCEAALRKFALGFPEAHEDFPWGERVVKVRKKVFVFMGHPDGGLTLSVKLPESQNRGADASVHRADGIRLGQ